MLVTTGHYTLRKTSHQGENSACVALAGAGNVGNGMHSVLLDTSPATALQHNRSPGIAGLVMVFRVSAGDKQGPSVGALSILIYSWFEKHALYVKYIIIIRHQIICMACPAQK